MGSFLVKSHFFANHQNNTKLAIDLERRMINETPAVSTANTTPVLGVLYFWTPPTKRHFR